MILKEDIIHTKTNKKYWKPLRKKVQRNTKWSSSLGLRPTFYPRRGDSVKCSPRSLSTLKSLDFCDLAVSLFLFPISISNFILCLLKNSKPIFPCHNTTGPVHCEDPWGTLCPLLAQGLQWMNFMNRVCKQMCIYTKKSPYDVAGWLQVYARPPTSQPR